MQIRRAGDRAIVIDVPDLSTVLALARGLRKSHVAGIRDIVPAAKTVFVSAWSPAAVRRIIATVEQLDAAVVEAVAAARTVDIDVVYDGADLSVVADLLGTSVEALIDAHTSQTWTAGFGGFAPGFMYLTGENRTLDVRRRDTPRTVVPAGAVAIAGGFSAVYPRESPGGWQLLGRTAAQMWDSSREPPALVAPGDRVRFHAVRELVEVTRIEEHREVRADLTVIEPGMQALVEDLGRPGHAAIGVTTSGAMDRVALRMANSLVGNPDSAATIESLFGGLRLRAERDVVIAVAGADVEVRVTAGEHERSIEVGRPFLLGSGEEVELGAPTAGARAYVAVRGGIDVEPELGSRSADVLSGLGPAPLRTGTALSVGPLPRNAVGAPVRLQKPPSDVELRFVPGPRADWFVDPSVLTAQTWKVTSKSNRVGLRLDGTPLERWTAEELPSEGMTRGSIQVPPDGQPVLFLADHPVTGGYPVVGTVLDADTDLAGQLLPGNRVRFVPVDAEPN